MKKEVRVRMFLDTGNDEFGLHMDSKGFDEKTPVQNSLTIASMLDLARRQELSKILSK